MKISPNKLKALALARLTGETAHYVFSGYLWSIYPNGYSHWHYRCDKNGKPV